MIYSTTRTNSTLRKDLIASIKPGEHIRVWEEHNRFINSPYPLYRIYAETLENSKATELIRGSSNYKEITKEELENAVGQNEAMALWRSYTFSKRTPEKPSLIIMAGYPLSGKSTLSDLILKRCPDNTLLIESDFIRDLVAKANGYGSPKYNYTETLKTFNIAHELIRIGLSNSVNVILDATNLQEKGRFEAFSAADEYAAPVAVIFIDAPENVATERLKVATPDKRAAYEHMLQTKFTKVEGNRLFLTVDSSLDPEQMVASLIDKLPIRMSSF